MVIAPSTKKTKMEPQGSILALSPPTDQLSRYKIPLCCPDKTCTDQEDLLALATMDTSEMIRFFETTRFIDSKTVALMTKLKVWGECLSRAKCVTPDGLEVDISGMDGDSFQRLYKRQLTLRTPSVLKEVQHTLHVLETKDEEQEKRDREKSDDATHFSDVCESLAQLNKPKTRTLLTKKDDNAIVDKTVEFDQAKKADNVVVDKTLDFSQVTDTPVDDRASRGRRTSFGFVGTSDTLIKKKEYLKKIESQSPLHRKGRRLTRPRRYVCRTRSPRIVKSLSRRYILGNPFIMP